MRPVRITLRGFGSFADEQSLDFSELEEIFLVSGRTGSGKTTIFDAIVYALYGRVPGTRSESDVRSTFIDDRKETAVDLEFLLHGKRYKVARTIKASRLKKSPDEVRLHKAAAFYELEEGRYVPKDDLKNPTAVSAHISELLHLSSDEFSKIILLPQGEFQKFLEDDSRGRQVILEKLFPTEHHKRVTEALRERRNEIQREMKSLSGQIEQLEERFDPRTFEQRASALITQIEKEQGDIAELDASLARANQKLAKDEGLFKDYEKLDTLTTRAEALEKEKEKIEELKRSLDRARKADTLMPEVSRLDGEISELEGLESQKIACTRELEDLRRELDEVQEEAKGIPEMRERVSRLDGEVGKLEPLVEKERELGRVRGEEKEAEQALRDAKEALDTARNELKKTVGSITDVKKSLKTLEQDEAKYPEALKALNGAKKLQELSEKYEEKKKEHEDLEDSLKELQDTRAEKGREQEEAEQELKRLKERKEASLAATLAATLEKGKPCPVCGSTAHPHPADLEIEAFVDEELLAQTEVKVQGLIGEISSLETEIRSAKKRKTNAESDMKKLEAGHPLPVEEAERAVQEKEAEVSLLEASREELTKARENLEKLERDREELEGKRDEAQGAHGEMDKALGSLKVNVKGLEQDLQGLSDVESTIQRKTEEAKDLRKKIDDIQSRENALRESRAELEARLKQIAHSWEKKAGEIDSLRGDIDRKSTERGFKSIDEVRSAVLPDPEKEAVEERINGYTAEVQETGAQIRHLQESIGDRPRPDVEGQRAAIGELEKKKKHREAQKDSLSGELKDLERDKEAHERLHASLSKLKTESKIVVELSDDLSGNNDKRINFQNFVLHSYLRQVTAFASRRLKVMSEGRYDLLVSEDPLDLRKQGGLELQVMDAYTGTKRSVRTLSGGEKFMASISLALGLADAIQSRAGQVEMDAIFIDEGFGTLDDSALDHALTILDDIRENRMVGVISHVSELRNRIPCQVRVEKSVEGSRIRVQ